MKQSNINPLIKLKWDMWKARIAGNQNKYRAALNVVDLLFSHWFAGRFKKEQQRQQLKIIQLAFIDV